MKLSQDQKTVVKSLSACTVIGILADIIGQLIKGNFSLSDTLLFSLFLILGFLALGVFYILGMRTPKK
ncbi:MAG: hypothetical protein MJY56_03890 [Bacteroidales bacterium]|nr:hypothetical protein [Bacteroidales bacterium]